MNTEPKMRTPTACWSLAATMLLVAGCWAPNLIVRNPMVVWNETSKVASAEVANVGNLAAGEFLVYFNGDENPESQNHRPQVRHQVAGLAPGGAVQLTADFGPLAHADNANLGRVHQITIIADPKNAVRERREDDNEVTATPCAPAASDVASGTTGSIQMSQSFNETRAVNLTVLGAANRIVEKLLLEGLNMGSPGKLGARIYDGASQALIASADATVSAGMNQTVEIPVSVALTAGHVYLVGFYVETNPVSQGSGNFFRPTGFSSLSSPTPYTEASGVFRINSAHSIGADAFPANPNIFVLQMTVFTRCP